jgi:ABC-type nitrate/sulfonate/bicarbonate transport system substrate-binding protein
VRRERGRSLVGKTAVALACVVGVLGAVPTFGDRGATAWAAGPTKVIVAHGNSLGWATDYIARNEGFFRKEGLDVELTVIGGGDAQTIPAVMSGNVQFGASTCIAILQAISKGADFAIVSPMVEQFVVEFVMNREVARKLEITSSMSVEEKVRKLKGLRAGVLDVGGGLHLLLNGLARKYGLDPNRDYTVTGMNPYSAMLASLKRGDIDLATAAIPYGDEAVKAGYATMFIDFWRGEVPAFNGALHEALYVTRKYAREHPDVVEAMRRALAQSIALIQRDPQAAVESLAKSFPSTSRDILQTVVVGGVRGFPRAAVIPRKGFQIIRAFTAESVTPAVRGIAYEKAVWPSAQEK